MQTGVLLGFLGYFIYACSDAMIKALGPSLPIYEIAFFTALFALIPALFTKRREDSWAAIFVPRNKALLAVRMTSGTIGGLLAVVAFTTLPLAEAYALIFLLPIFVTVLSAVFLGETIGWKRRGAVVVGLLGVVLVVRPGFRDILPGHLAAVGAALCGAVTVIVLRKLGPTERRITLIGSVIVASIAFNGVLMIPTFVVPTPDLFHLLVGAGVCAGLGHLVQVFATRAAPANRVAPTQYSQIIWAAVIGATFFGEVPDLVGIAGMALVGVAGLFTFLREEERSKWSWRTPLVRNRI